MNLQVGDVVQLKSGGPYMTVQEIDGPNVYCTWFNEKGDRKTEGFQASTLTKD